MPDDVTVEYEIAHDLAHHIITEVRWFITEKPVDLTL